MKTYQHRLLWFATPEKGFYPYQVLHEKAEILWFLGRLPGARKCYEENLKAAQASGLSSLAAHSMLKLSRVVYSLGDVDAALSLAEQGGEIFKRIGDRLNLTGAGIIMGIICSSRGNYPAAFEHFNQSLENAREQGDIRNQGNIYNALGNLSFYRADLDQALEYYLKMRDISEGLGDQIGMGRVLGNISAVYKQRGQLDLALEHSRRALEIGRELGDSTFITQAVGNLGSVYTDMKKYDDALACFQLQLDGAMKMGYVRDQAIAHSSIARIHFDLGQYSEAREFFDRSLPLFRRLESRYDLCEILLDQAEVCNELDDPERSKDSAAEALDIAREINKQDTIEKAQAFLNKLGEKAVN
ncbi:MAG: tetratricopeptide repeat protein [bacterium]|nr:tetratricopeptide repeat protein [bacterium]